MCGKVDWMAQGTLGATSDAYVDRRRGIDDERQQCRLVIEGILVFYWNTLAHMVTLFLSLPK